MDASPHIGLVPEQRLLNQAGLLVHLDLLPLQPEQAVLDSHQSSSRHDAASVLHLLTFISTDLPAPASSSSLLHWPDGGALALDEVWPKH